MPLATQSILEGAKKKKSTQTTLTNKATPSAGLAKAIQQSNGKPATTAPKSTGVKPAVNTGATQREEAKKKPAEVKSVLGGVNNILNKVKNTDNKVFTEKGKAVDKNYLNELTNLRPHEESYNELTAVEKRINEIYTAKSQGANVDADMSELEKRRQELIKENKKQEDRIEYVEKPLYQQAYNDAVTKGDTERADQLKDILNSMDDPMALKLAKSGIATMGNAMVDATVGFYDSMKDAIYEQQAVGLQQQADFLREHGSYEMADARQKEADEARKKADEFSPFNEENISAQLRNDLIYQHELARIGTSDTSKILFDITDNVANMFPTIATGSMIPFTTQIISGTYNQNLQKGYDPRTSMLNACLIASVEVFSENIGSVTGFAVKEVPILNKAFTSVMDTPIGRGWAVMMGNKIIQDPLSEGFEELFSGLVDPLVDHYTLGTDVEYDFGDLSYEFMMGAVTSVVMGAPSVISDRYISVKNTKQANMIKQELMELESMKVTGTLTEQQASALNVAIEFGNGALADFKERSVLNDAIQLESDLSDVPSLQERAEMYAEAMKPTNDEYVKAVQASIDKIATIEYQQLQQQNINVDERAWMMTDAKTRQEIRDLVAKGVNLNYDEYINFNNEDYRKAMVEIAENKIKGENGVPLRTAEYLALTEDERKRLNDIADFGERSKMEIWNTWLGGSNGYIDRNGRIRLNTVQQTSIDPQKLANLENFDLSDGIDEKGRAKYNSTKLTELGKLISREANVFETATHEMVHYLEHTKGWSKLKDLVIETLGGQEKFDLAKDRMRQLYEANGIFNSVPENEVIAYTIQTQIGNKDFLYKAMQYNNSAIFRMMNSLKTMLSGDLSAVEKIENAFYEGYREATKNYELGLTEYSKTADEILADKRLQFRKLQNASTSAEEVPFNSAEEINTFQEAFREYGNLSDFKYDDIQSALESGFVTVYSDNAIVDGAFVTPSLQEAQKLAGENEVFSKKIPIGDVAWVDNTGGYYTKVTPDRIGIESLNNDLNDGEGTPEYSLSTVFQGIGMNLDFTGDRVTAFYNGNEVETVTEDMVRNSSVGRMVELGKRQKTVSEKQGDQMIEFYTKMANTILSTRDPQMYWALSGALAYQPFLKEASAKELDESGSLKSSAFTSNSDKQYNRTFDVTTICNKTQQLINVMSETMLKLKRGLTENEIVGIVYDEVAKAKEPVPCPVCYVFSRWVGTGGLLNNISNYQKEYAEYSEADLNTLVERYNTLCKEVDDIVAKEKAKTNGKSKFTGTDAREQLDETLNKEYYDLLDKKSRLDGISRINGTEVKLSEKDTARLNELEDYMKILDRWAWLGMVRLKKVGGKKNYHYELNDNYKPVNEDILFDLNKGETFAKEYPDTWKYRTTRGPAMGKAITPYAPEVLGQTIIGFAGNPNNLKTLGTKRSEATNAFLNPTGKIRGTNNSASLFDRAVKNARRQNLIGGSRAQSTSDFRFEFVTDYLMHFMQLEAIGSYGQTYTKVPEAVGLLASANYEVNCSLMAEGYGWEEVSEGTEGAFQLDDGKYYKLKFSGVTGMDAETAFDLSRRFNNVQPIMVGINDNHIRLCMMDDRITFIIPYHASGSNETRYMSMMQSVNEAVEKDARSDYSSIQTDTEIENATVQQKRNRDLRLKIIMGKAGNINPTTIESTYLRDLWERFYDKSKGDTETYHNFLAKQQAEQIFPYEFWDKNSTIETADVNTKRFAEYCNDLGIKPRFEKFMYTDGTGASQYSTEDGRTYAKGYWKMLIDRSMYNLDGSYHYQQAVSASNLMTNPQFNSEQVMFRDAMAKAYGIREEAQSKQFKASKTAEITNRVLDRVAKGEGQHSLSIGEKTELTEAYNDALARNDRYALEQIVKAYARGNGYVEETFHGTDQFGFTKIDVSSESDDNISFFVTTSPETADTYSYESGTREIGNEKDNYTSSELEELEYDARDNLHRELTNVADLINREVGDNRYVDFAPLLDGVTKIVDEHHDDIDEVSAMVSDFLDQTLLYDVHERYLENGGEQKDFYEWLIDGDGNHIHRACYDAINSCEILAGILNQSSRNGNYHFYVNPDGVFEIDCKGRNWNTIEGDNKVLSETNHGRYWTTRSISKWAHDNGYTGVLFKNIRDDGGKGSNYFSSIEPADVYSLFDPQRQVKSADPVTYDKRGNVIPLEQRFDRANDDLRYSLGTDFGYHYGAKNLDYNTKSEKLWQRGGRGTGAFGTGTYFFGEQNSEPWFSKNRTEHKVDFSDYNMFKVKNKQEGYDLHDYLNMLDDLYFQYGTETQNFSEQKYKDSVARIVNELNELSEEKESLDESEVAKFRSQIETIEDDYFADELINSATYDGKVLPAELAYELETTTDRRYTNGQRNADRWEQLAEYVPKIAKILGVSEDTLVDLSAYAMSTAKEDSQRGDFRGGIYDSVGTRLMKALGYEGIDVRGIKGLDDSKYGSVIYDLRPETVQYSITLTPRQIRQVAPHSMKDGKLKDATTQLKEMLRDPRGFGNAYIDLGNSLEFADITAGGALINYESLQHMLRNIHGINVNDIGEVISKINEPVMAFDYYDSRKKKMNRNVFVEHKKIPYMLAFSDSNGTPELTNLFNVFDRATSFSKYVNEAIKQGREVYLNERSEKFLDKFLKPEGGGLTTGDVLGVQHEISAEDGTAEAVEALAKLKEHAEKATTKSSDDYRRELIDLEWTIAEKLVATKNPRFADLKEAMEDTSELHEGDFAWIGDYLDNYIESEQHGEEYADVKDLVDERTNVIKLLNEARQSENERERKAKEQKQTPVETTPSNTPTNKKADELSERYGNIETGMNPKARESQIPKKTAKDNQTSKVVRTVYESKNVTDEQASDVRAKVAEGKWTYKPQSMETLMKKGRELLYNHETLTEARDWLSNKQEGRLTPEEIAMGEALLMEYSKAKDMDNFNTVLDRLVREATPAGRKINSFKLLKTATPEGRAYVVKQQVKRMTERFEKRLKKKDIKLNVSDANMQRLIDASTDAEVADAMNIIGAELAEQVPPSALDKINTWRYLAMLGNARTHLRNILGNVGMGAMKNVKDAIGTLMEKTISKDKRTKAFVSRFGADTAFRAKAQEVYKSEYKQLLEEGKSKYSLEDLVGKNKKAFKDKGIGKFINLASEYNGKLLSAEDSKFIQYHFENSYAGFLKARGVDLNNFDVNSDIAKEAGEYARNEAVKATFHDDSYIAKKLNEVARKNTISNILVNSVLPFKQTPINIAKRMFEYSPAGLLKTTAVISDSLKNKKANANEIIDNLSMNMTGTMIAMLGFYLAKAGIFRTKDDDKDRKKYMDQDVYGEQDYALVFPHGTYTIDWFTPAIAPLGFGAEVYKKLVDDDDVEVTDVVSTGIDLISNLADPLVETSMLSSLASTLSSYESEGSKKLGNMMWNMATSYASQFFPTLGGQIARSIDPYRRTTYPNDGSWDSFIRQLRGKTPFLSQKNEPYVNRHGEEVKQPDLGMGAFGRFLLNGVSVGYYKENIADEYDDEMVRLYEQTGEASALPSTASKSFTEDGEKTKLTNEDYTAYNKERWRRENEKVRAFMDSDIYDSMTDEARVEVIEKLRKASGDEAKSVFTVGSADSMEYMDAVVKSVYNNMEGEHKKDDFMDWLGTNNLTAEQKNKYYDEVYGDSKLVEYVNDMNLSDKDAYAIKEAVATSTGVEGADGKSIKNSRALEVRKKYEEAGVYDDVIAYIEANGLNAGDVGLNKSVVAMSDAKAKSEYEKIFDDAYAEAVSSSKTKSSGGGGSGRSSKKRKSVARELTVDQIINQIVAKSSKSTSTATTIRNILKKTKGKSKSEIRKQFKISGLDDLIKSYLKDHPYADKSMFGY